MMPNKKSRSEWLASVTPPFRIAGHRVAAAAVAGALVVGAALLIWKIDEASPTGIVAYEFGQNPIDADAARTAIEADWWFLAGYGLILLASTLSARLLAFSDFGKGVTSFGVAAAVVTIVADVAENCLLLGHDRNLAAVAATIKFVALIPALVVALMSVGAVLRLCRSRFLVRGGGLWGDVIERDARTARGEDELRWHRGYWIPREGRKAGATAICLSGGGIRSGCVAMGAMQTFSGTNPDPNGKDLPKVIDEVDYIISVSGGGYSAGARLLAMQKKEGDSMAPSKLSDRYAAGSPEFEHMRKHSSYIADTPAQLLDALTKVAKNMILSLVVLFAPAVVLGVLVGLFYDQVPLAAFVPVPDAFLGETDNNLIGGWTASMDPPASGLVDNSGAVWLAVVVPAALGIVMFSFSVLIEVFWTNEWAESCRYATRKVAMAWTAFTLLMLLIVAGLPALIRACAALANDDGETAFVLAGSTASAVVVLNYFGVLAAMAWKNKAFFSRFASKFGAGGVKPGAAKALPRGVFQLILVVLTLVVLAAAWLATVGGVGAVIFYVAATNGDPLVPRAAWTTLLVALVAIVVVGCPDVTSFSLHPFYRRRLARAFAVRRRNRAGRVFAEPYPDKEGTRLDEYGSVGGVDIPEFVFAAAATVSGEMKPAPGLNVVSFALGHNYIGGPDVGWMKTGKLFEKSTSRIKRDLTVEAAVAVSGAAFASAMGRQNNGYQTLLAVSGARLGTWLPNPNYLRLSMEEQNLQAWSWPQGLPRFRGFTYLLREVFGINPDAGRLVQVTDGGHYENLGLVEALRRRCTLIYCIDGSGDTPPRLGTLADALRLAKYELGVDIVFDHGDDLNPSNLVPGSGTTFGPDDQFEALNDRITKGAVIRGQIYYPDAAGLPKDTGATLIYAKAVLSEQCPLWLQTYAGANDIFPHDSTSDQWFNEGQFAAYTELGRLIAAEALTAVLSASAAPSDQQDTAS